MSDPRWEDRAKKAEANLTETEEQVALAEAEAERLREALQKIADVTFGWTRPMSINERVQAIGKIARAALGGEE